MVGFTRAFLFAGAKRLVVSLWPVNDRATPDFMAGFYRAMRDGRATADALREAKLGMLRGRVEAYRHPYFWGAFVAVGGW
jgi:CHAT domain-containing protein